MMQIRLLVYLVGFVGLVCSCSMSKFVPKVDRISEGPNGAYITLYTSSGEKVNGELIALDSHNVFVLEDDGVQRIPKLKISHFVLKYAKGVRYGWTIPTYTLATISHGFFAALTAPINLLVTTIVTASSIKSHKYTSKNMSYEEMVMFARFPQGIPSRIDLSMIK